MSLRLVYAVLIVSVFGPLFQGCTTGNGSGEHHQSKESGKAASVPKQDQHYHYSVYLENSGSLNGYLNVSGDGSFRDAVYSLITGINGFGEKASLNLYDINTVVIPVARNATAAGVNDYISNLDADNFERRSKASGGNQAKSDLRAVFKQVLDSTNGNTVSILISDCIFSPDKGNALDYLTQQKAGIQGFFGEKLAAAGFATLVLQCFSDFNGTYYYQDNSSLNASFRSRPYYITCIGPEEAVRGLFKYVEDKFRPKGYRDFLFLTARKTYDVRPSVVMNTAYYNYEPDRPMVVTGAQKGGPDGMFRLFVKTDFSGLPVSGNYVLQPGNYEISPGYSVERVAALSEQAGPFTHELTIVAPKAVRGAVRIALNTKLPEWVAASNLDADKGLSPEALEGKTFGIRYLVGGIYDAYYAREARPQYFSFSITVKD